MCVVGTSITSAHGPQDSLTDSHWLTIISIVSIVTLRMAGQGMRSAAEVIMEIRLTQHHSVVFSREPGWASGGICSFCRVLGH